uniref:Uncharacterized protein n=1 Tax=Glossina austeni TaxID=7395 RepID=A0A1A9UFK1_GLOAU
MQTRTRKHKHESLLANTHAHFMHVVINANNAGNIFVLFAIVAVTFSCSCSELTTKAVLHASPVTCFHQNRRLINDERFILGLFGPSRLKKLLSFKYYEELRGFDVKRICPLGGKWVRNDWSKVENK